MSSSAISKSMVIQYLVFIIASMLVLGYFLKIFEYGKPIEIARAMRNIAIVGIEHSNNSKADPAYDVYFSAYRDLNDRLAGFSLGKYTIDASKGFYILSDPNLNRNHTYLGNFDSYLLNTKQTQATTLFPISLFPNEGSNPHTKLTPFLVTSSSFSMSQDCYPQYENSTKLGDTAHWYVVSVDNNQEVIRQVSSTSMHAGHYIFGGNCNFYTDTNWEMKGFLKKGYLGVGPFREARDAYDLAQKTHANSILQLSPSSYPMGIQEHSHEFLTQNPNNSTAGSGFVYILLYDF